jgi:hypothetical protein
MKKITFLFILMVSSLGFSQSLPIDFSDPLDNNFVGNGGSVFSAAFSPTDGTNPVGKIIGGTAQYDSRIDLLLGTYIDMTTSNKTFTFKFYSTEAIVMNGLFQINHEAAGGYPIEMPFVTNGNIGWQTITLDFSAAKNGYPNAGLPVVYGQYAGLSVFTNFGDTGTSTYYVDDIAGAANGAVVPSVPAPTVAAPTPPNRNAADVISLFSNAYSNITINDWNAGAGWGGGSTITDVLIDTNPTKKIVFGDYIGVDFGAGNHIDATAMTSFHLDFWIPSTTDLVGKVLNPKLVQFGGGTAEVSALLLTYLPTEKGTWASIDAPLSTFAGNQNRNDIAQFVLSSNLGLVYVDNIYLYKGTPLATASFEKSNIKMYPNPVKNTLNIDANASINKVSVYNILGQEVLTASPKSNSASLQTSALQKGVYMVRTDIDGNISTSKFIKE